MSTPLRGDGPDLLVTGAAGFVGGHLLRRLGPRAAGHARVPQPGLRAADLTDPAAARALLTGWRPRAVVHAAAAVRRGTSPAELHRGNVEATRNLLQALPDSVERVVFLSTADVYSGDREGPIPETDPAQPKTSYGAAKLAAEAEVAAWARGTGAAALVLRPFLVYGPGLRPDTLLGAALRAARAGEALATTAGTPLRDPVHVDDVAEAVARAVEVPLSGLHVLNVGRGEAWSVRQMVLEVYRACGAQVAPNFGARPEPPDERRSLVADARRLEGTLGVRCRIPFAQGIAATVKEDHGPS